MLKLLMRKMNSEIWELVSDVEYEHDNDAYGSFWGSPHNPSVSHLLAVDSWRADIVLHALNVSESDHTRSQAKPLNFSVKPQYMNYEELEKKTLEQASGPHGPADPAGTVDGTPKTYWK